MFSVPAAIRRVSGPPPVEAPIFTGPVTIAPVAVDTAFSHDMSQYFSGDPVDSYALTNDGGQAWLSINTSTGELSGQTPATPVTVSGVIVTATNTGGSTPTDAFDFEVEAGAAETDFIMQVAIPTDTTEFHIRPKGNGNYTTIDWGDGTAPTELINASATDPGWRHTYADLGNYEIRMSGTVFSGMWMRYSDTKEMITSVDNVGEIGWLGGTSMYEGFYNCVNLTSFTWGNSDWAGTSLSNMLYTSTVLSSFDLTGINPINLTNIDYLIYNSRQIASIDLTPIATAPLTNGIYAFGYTTICADINLDVLDVSNMTAFNNILEGNNVWTTAQYDATLLSWSSQSVQVNARANMGTVKYSASHKQYRDILTDAPNLWTLTDGGQA